MLEWPCGCDYLLMFYIKSIELKGYSGMIVMMHWGMRLVEGVFVDICIMFPAMRYTRAVRSWDLGGEVGWSLWGLWVVSSHLR